MSQGFRDHLSRTYGLSGRSPRAASDVDELIREHAHIVVRVARRIARRTGGAVDVDDLVSAGMLGLIDAHGKYSPDGGRDFGTYAEFRIKGSILDELRRMDPMTQPMRRKARALDKARGALRQDLGRDASDEELAERLSVDVEQLRQMVDEVQPMTFVGVDEVDFTDLRDELALARVDRATLKATLAKAIGSLPERTQQLLSLYYFHDLTLREIGEVLEVTEARVCQLHKEAMKRMREFLGEGT